MIVYKLEFNQNQNCFHISEIGENSNRGWRSLSSDISQDNLNYLAESIHAINSKPTFKEAEIICEALEVYAFNKKIEEVKKLSDIITKFAVAKVKSKQDTIFDEMIINGNIKTAKA